MQSHQSRLYTLASYTKSPRFEIRLLFSVVGKPLLQLSQCGRDRQPGRPHCGKKSADQPDEDCPDNSLNEKVGRHIERKCHLAEALKVHRSGVKLVESRICEGRSHN